MNKKQNKLTYAQRARKIQAKYKNAANDKLEAESMERELQSLMQEQEAYKKANGIGTEDTQVFANGGGNNQILGYPETIRPINQITDTLNTNLAVPSYYNQVNQGILSGEQGFWNTPQTRNTVYNPTIDWGQEAVNRLTAPLPPLYTPTYGNAQQPLSQPVSTSTPSISTSNPSVATTSPAVASPEVVRDNTSISAITPKPVSQLTNPMNTELATDSTMQDRLDKSELYRQLYNNQGSDPNKTSLVPSYISAGAGILGNLGQMLMDKRPNQIISPTYIPSKLDLTEEKLQADKQAQEAGNVARRNLRSGALSTGQILANLAGLESGIQGQRDKTMTQLGTAEKQYNVGAVNQAGQINAAQKARDLLINQQLGDAWRQRQRDYLSGAVGIIPQAMQDINRIRYQDKYLGQLSQAEKNRLAALNSWYPNYYLGQNNLPQYRGQ